MKSPGNSGAPPNMPQPQGNVTPYGQATPFNPQYQNFLPTDPNAMATGLTPEMVSQINAPPPLPINQQPAMAAPPAGNPNDMKAILAMLIQKNRENTMHNQGFGYQQSGHGGDR